MVAMLAARARGAVARALRGAFLRPWLSGMRFPRRFVAIAGIERGICRLNSRVRWKDRIESVVEDVEFQRGLPLSTNPAARLVAVQRWSGRFLAETKRVQNIPVEVGHNTRARFEIRGENGDMSHNVTRAPGSTVIPRDVYIAYCTEVYTQETVQWSIFSEKSICGTPWCIELVETMSISVSKSVETWVMNDSYTIINIGGHIFRSEPSAALQ